MTAQTKRNYVFYVLMLAVFGMLIWWVMSRGELYHGLPVVAQTAQDASGAARHTVVGKVLSSGELFAAGLRESLHHPLPLLLLQIISILIVARIFSSVFKYFGQPGVIGEIMAGIALGPSVLGYFFPEAFHFLFAPDSLLSLNVISRIGLILFMFIIGMELDLKIIKKKASETLVISHASIIVPFFLGLLLAYYVYPEFGSGRTDFVSFALFIGISVSITAFPVLARIVQERNLGKTQMGMLAIASAANNDITAWCMLAAIIAVAKAGSVASALYTIGFAAVYILFMFTVIRPFFKKVGNIYNNQEVLNKTFVASIFLVLIISSYITEVLGVHALFGAFLAGVVMPTNINFRRVITEKVEDVALLLLLPLFFVFTGLRTEIGLLNSAHLWIICGLFILVSIVGKLAGATLSARFVGESWKDSLSIGVLMNTRGLMELIVLNIGYELGILPSEIFVIFVIMALFTTFMATPCLFLIEKLFRKRHREARSAIWTMPRILISLGNPENGPLFLRVIHLLGGDYVNKARLTAVHYTMDTDTSPINAEEYAFRGFAPLLREAGKLGLKVNTHYEVTDHYLKTLTDLIRHDGYDLLVIGSGPDFMRDYATVPRKGLIFNSELQRLGNLFNTDRWHFPGETPSDKVRRLFNSVRCMLCVVVDRGLGDVKDVGVILFDHRDANLLPFAEPITDRSNLHVTVMSKELPQKFQEDLDEMLAACSGHCTLTGHSETPLHEFIAGKQLIIISYQSWLNITATMPSLIPLLPSFLVVKPGSNSYPGAIGEGSVKAGATGHTGKAAAPEANK